MEATSSYAEKIQASFLGFDKYRFLKSTLAELLHGNGDIELGARIRHDSSIVVSHVHPINSAAKDRRLNGFLVSNIEELETDPRLALSHIMGPLNVYDEMDKSADREKLILRLSRNISRTMDEKIKGEIMKTYPADNQYLAFPETKECREGLGAFARRMGGVDSWEMGKRFVLFPTKTCIMDGIQQF